MTQPIAGLYELPGRPASRSAAEPTLERAMLDSPRRAEILAWLNDGLRPAQPGRLELEYPLALAPEAADRHIVLSSGGAPISHALLRSAAVAARDQSLGLTMISLVYTDPKHRRRGYAARCLEACAERARSEASGMLALWSDAHSFYEQSGFLPAGNDMLCTIDIDICQRASERVQTPNDVGEPAPDDWPILEELYVAKPVHAKRPPGALQILAQIPGCRVIVAREQGQPVAYAALGRGEDFPGIIHEWAGSPGGVIACCSTFSQQWRLEQAEHSLDGLRVRPLHLLCSPCREEAPWMLRASGARVFRGSFALLRLLDAAIVWQSVATGAPGLEQMTLTNADRAGSSLEFLLSTSTGQRRLDQRQALDLLFGPGLPTEISSSLSVDEQQAIEQHLPWPLFLWGFDSI